MTGPLPTDDDYRAARRATERGSTLAQCREAIAHALAEAREQGRRAALATIQGGGDGVDTDQG